MVEGLAIFGGVSAAWSLAKDVRCFVKKLKRAGCDIKDLDLRFNDDVRRLCHCKNVLFSFESRLPKIDAEHLRDLARKIRRIAASLKRNFETHFHGSRWSRLMWATHGSSIVKAEIDLSFWIARLRAAITDFGLFDLSNTSGDRTLCSDEPRAYGKASEVPDDDSSTSQTLVNHTEGNSPRHGKGKASEFVDLQTMRDEMQAAMLSTGGAPSISSLATKSIIAKFGLRTIIQDDESLFTQYHNAQELFNSEEFALAVENKATVLLGICIYVRMELSFLRELLAFGFSDKDLPLGSSVLGQCSLWSRAKIDSFGKSQHIFAPSARSEGDSFYEQRILLEGDDGPWSARLPTATNKSTLLGKGSSGIVYQVVVDPESHYSTEDSKPFALKVFNEATRSIEQYQREIDMLRELSKSSHHQHIVRHVATYKTDGQFSILYPKADMDLRQMMNQRPVDLSLEVSWYLRQFHGLADALRKIHYPHEIANSSHTSRAGWHHDLKPSNILMFGGTAGQITEPRLAITDFGSASFAGQSNMPGTSIYGAPEAYLPHQGVRFAERGRAYDVWSLGCVFIEILCWLFADPIDPLARSLRSRLDDDISSTGDQSEAFWCEDRNGIVSLRPSVTAALNTISEKASHDPRLLQIIGLVRRSLVIDPDKRIDAEQFATRFQSILQSDEDGSEDDRIFKSLRQHTPEGNEEDTFMAPPQSHPSPRRRFWPPWRWKACKRAGGTQRKPQDHTTPVPLQDHSTASTLSKSSSKIQARQEQLPTKSRHVAPLDQDHSDLTGSSSSSRLTRRRRAYLLAGQEA
jgi:serine/threonine protein kinase